MTFQLILYPISIIFALVFGVAWMAVLWKLRRKGKIYPILFKISIIAGVILIVALLYGIVVNLH